MEYLPSVAGDMARAIAVAERVPVSLPGCCVLGILSASIGAGIQVRYNAQTVTRANLYLVPSADSGTGKSKCFNQAARPLFTFEREILENWRRHTLPGLQADKELLESEVNALKKSVGKKDGGIDREATRRELEEKKARLLELDNMMQPPILTVEDITSEALASVMAKRGEVLASLSPDAGKSIQNLLGRYTDGQTDDNIYLKGFSGDYCRVTRQTREPVLLNHPCLTLLWLVQPDKTEKLLREVSLTDGGFCPRLLICHTHTQATHITGDQQGIPGEVLSAYDSLIRELLTAYCHIAEPFTIDPTPAALRLLTDHHNKIVDRRLSDLKDITSYAARWTEQAWRLSVVLHAARHGAHAHEHPLSAETAAAAITLADWYAAQQLDILSGGRWQARRDRENEVLKLLANIPDGITPRDVLTARITKTAQDARDLLTGMEQQGQLTGRDHTPKDGGWTVRKYTRQAAR